MSGTDLGDCVSGYATSGPDLEDAAARRMETGNGCGRCSRCVSINADSAVPLMVVMLPTMAVVMATMAVVLTTMAVGLQRSWRPLYGTDETLSGSKVVIVRGTRKAKCGTGIRNVVVGIVLREGEGGTAVPGTEICTVPGPVPGSGTNEWPPLSRGWWGLAFDFAAPTGCLVLIYRIATTRRNKRGPRPHTCRYPAYERQGQVRYLPTRYVPTRVLADARGTHAGYNCARRESGWWRVR
eukprot:1664652-Rhodomonas_salina.3